MTRPTCGRVGARFFEGAKRVEPLVGGWSGGGCRGTLASGIGAG